MQAPDPVGAEADLLRLRGLFEQAPGFIAIFTGPEHRFAFVNAAHVRLFGERQAVPRPVREVFPEVTEQGIPALMDRVYATGERHVAQALPVRLTDPADGGASEVLIDVIFEPVRDESGRVSGIFLEGHDVTARVHAERERERVARHLSEQARFLDDISATTPDFLYAFDRDGRFRWANRRLLQVWGRRLDEIVGRTCLELGYEPWHHEMHMREIAEVVRERRPVRGEVPFTAVLTGISGVYEYIFSPVFDASGEVDWVAGSTRDVTQRKKEEEALREADRRKDEFLAMLAHELRNPLAPVRNALGLLAREPLGERGRRAVEMGVRQVAQLSRLVDDLLEVSRMTRGLIQLKPGAVELTGLLRDVAENLQPVFAEAGLAFTLDLPDETVHLQADPSRLVQVVENLLANAAKYTDRGGRVRLSLRRLTEEVEVAVADTGIGIPGDQLDRLFEPFSQIDSSIDRSRGGLGIGLALVKRLVTLHGGTVTAESAGAGQGARFSVRLPAPAA